MRVSEERLATVLTRPPSRLDPSQVNPVASLVVDSIAVARAPIADEIRYAGSFLLAALGGDEPGGTRLTIPVAMQVLAREEGISLARIQGYLGELGERDPLLRLLVDGLLAHSPVWGRRRPSLEAEAVAQVIYLLLRMFEWQEEADALDRALL